MPNSATELQMTSQTHSGQQGEEGYVAQQADVVFFHTSPVHIDTFNRLRDTLAPGLEIAHVVREDLLVAAEKVGGINEAIEFRVTDESLLCLFCANDQLPENGRSLTSKQAVNRAQDCIFLLPATPVKMILQSRPRRLLGLERS